MNRLQVLRGPQQADGSDRTADPAAPAFDAPAAEKAAP
jgi:hypothetical protein